ncbi:DUF397 domain-containing protein [Streptomyces sp. NPDC001941]|uniref:DUF397 domain-containing protein n=1 Tax=Streptomyces sp. NPDC001941 TaxID=3154659 RepID=UPI00331E525E
MELHWEKSQFSTDASGSNCLELALDGDIVLLRESEQPEVVIRTSRAKLQAFLDGANSGQFDRYGTQSN